MSKKVRADVPPPVSPEISLRGRTIELVRRFDNEEKGRDFDDSGSGTTYAQWFADLLEEWAGRERRK